MFARPFRCRFLMSSSFLFGNLFIYSVYREGPFMEYATSGCVFALKIIQI